jgi:maltose/moltooligosaccharide transporter
MGVYMGIFNFFIVLPEIVVSIGFGKIIEKLADVRLFGGLDVRLAVVVVGGILMIIAAILMQRVIDPGEENLRAQKPALESVIAK